MKIAMAEEHGGDVLTGAPEGRRLLGKIIGKLTHEPAEPETVFLDFTGVRAATASFLRESVIGARTFLRARRSNWYVIVANPNDDVTEELAFVLDAGSDALLICHCDGKNLKSVEPIGRLEPMQRLTFDAVLARGETTASELHEAHPDQKVEITAWNNRLSSLVGRGLLAETSRGRVKRYRPVLTEV